jgi:hypothetical protein
MEKMRQRTTREYAPVVIERDSHQVRSEPREPPAQGAAQLRRAIAALAGLRLEHPPKRFVSGISGLEELRYVFDRLVLAKNEDEFRGVLADPFDESWKRGHPGWTDPRDQQAREGEASTES